MHRLFYFDTSIWLDFLEDRDEPNMPKSTWIRKLVEKIEKIGDKILFSDVVLFELEDQGYSRYEIEQIIEDFGDIIINTEATDEQVRRSKDLARKRDIPSGDALHSLIARDNIAVMVTFDRHFDKLRDITLSFNPKNLL